MSFVTTWIDLDSIMPSEIRQKKRTGIMISLYVAYKTKKKQMKKKKKKQKSPQTHRQNRD